MEKEIEIYNLEFSPYVTEFKISDYVFRRITNYETSFSGMMQLVESSGNEYSTKRQTGTHQITAIVTTPDKEKNAILPWGAKLTQLDDILFLLTLFTDRNVFKREDDGTNEVIIQDHRIHQYGGQFACSRSYEWVFKNRSTQEIRTPDEMGATPIFNWDKVDVGLEKTLNKVLETILSDKWQKEYETGYFLFLFRSMVQRQIIETSFILCWTIWEHIFAIRNRPWLDNKAMEKMSGDKKIAYVLNKFFLKNIDEQARKNIQRISKTRNRLIHFGIKTDQVDFDEMKMFIRLTEQLMAIILELSPSNLFNSFEDLSAFLSKKQTS